MGAWIDIEVKENSQSIVNNTSNIDVRAICYWDGWSYNHNEIISGVPSASGYLQIDGVTYDFRNYFNYYRTERGSEVLFTKNLTVSHDDNGKRTVVCHALYRTGVSSGDVSASKTVDLTDIPRFASITAAPNFHDEENPKIQYANYAGVVVSSLQACLSLDGKTDFTPYEPVVPGGNEHTFQLNESQREALRKATPNSNTLDVYFLLRTVIGGNTGISSAVAVMSIKYPKPVLSPIVKDTNAKTIAVTGNEDILVAGYSVASVAVNATARKHSTIISRRVENGHQVLDGDGTLSPVINAPIRIMATDSRGNTEEVEAGNTIVPYFAPSCQIENTMPDGNGTMLLPINGAWFNGSIGKTANSLTVQYQYRENYGDYSDWITIPTVTASDNDFTAQTTLEGLNYKSSYTFKARVIDAVVTDGITSAEKTVKAEPVFDWGQDDFTFNVPVSMSKNRISDVATPTESEDAANKGYVDNLMLKIYPVGAIYFAYNHTSPAALFGGTWTRIEDRFLLPAAASDTIGSTGGSSTHTLTENEMPKHKHWIDYATSGGFQSGQLSQGNYAASETAGSYGSVLSNESGGGEAHNNMPPYVLVSVWRRTA